LSAASPKTVRLIVAFGLALVLGVTSVVAPIRPAAAYRDLLPDLRMGNLYDLKIKTTSSGKKRLRFGTIVWNVGEGPLEVRATDRDGKSMGRVDQWITNAGGGGRRVLKPEARVFYAGDGHDHWHVQDFVGVDLYLKSAPDTRRRLQKLGFCLTDLRHMADPPANSPKRPGYSWRGCGNRKNDKVRMGISVGWGDDYPPSVAYQLINITGLPKGVYRLCATTNPDGVWRELANNMSNNSFWYDLGLDPARGTFRIRAKGHTACRPPGS
jgi:hypothetical protein